MQRMQMKMIRNGRLLKNKLIKLNSLQKCGYAFEQNKTIVELVSHNQEVRLIKGISNFGFRLNNGMFAVGPIVIFNEILLSWNIRNAEEINPHSLSLLRMFVPKFEMLIIGAGDDLKSIHPDLIPYLTRNRVPYELHHTKDAAKLYNMMVIDKRNVVACLVPQMSIGVPDKVPLINYQKLLEAKVNNDLANATAISDIFNKHFDTYRVYLHQNYISKEELKRKIAIENEAESRKRLTFNEIIADEVKAIKEEQAALEENDEPVKKSIFDSDQRPPIDPNKKLIK